MLIELDDVVEVTIDNDDNRTIQIETRNDDLGIEFLCRRTVINTVINDKIINNDNDNDNKNSNYHRRKSIVDQKKYHKNMYHYNYRHMRQYKYTFKKHKPIQQSYDNNG